MADIVGEIYEEVFEVAVNGAVFYGNTGSSAITNEIPIGLVNSINTNFTTVNSFVSNSLEVYLNGVKQLWGVGYIVTGATTFQFSNSPITGDEVTVAYSKP
jgi:hypothetical protein